MNHVNRKLKSLFEFNNIRIQKIFEMSQDTIITLFLSLFSATIFNKYSFNLNTNDDYLVVTTKLLIEIVILIILLYYLRKLISVVPFLFKYTNSYIPSRPSTDGEGLLGKVVTLAIVFSTISVKLKDKIKHISNFI